MSTVSPAANNNSDPRARWLVNLLGVGQLCGWGSLYYSFPLIAEAMSADLGWSKPGLYGAATLGLLATALAAYPVGVAIDRGYGRQVMGFAAVLAGVLMVIWSQATNMLMFYAAVTLLGVAQAALLYESAFTVITRRVGPERARSGITTLTLWGGFASTVFIPLIQWLLNHWGWREALLVLAGINALLCAGIYFYVIRPERDVLNAPEQEPAQQLTRNREALHNALRQPVFWALLAALTTYAAMFSAFTYHMYPLFLERGLGTTAVVQAIALIGPAQVAGRIILGLFASRVPIRIVGTVITLVFPLAFGALALFDADFLLVAMVCISYGCVNGIFTIVRGVAVPEMLSRHAYGAINGVITAPVFIAKAAAPLGAAALWTVGESYDWVLVAIVALACVLAASFALAAVLSHRHGRINTQGPKPC